MTFISFSRSHRHFETQILIEKCLCEDYILNQWLEFKQTSKYSWLGHGKEMIRFLWPWPHSQGHFIIKTLKMTLVCTLSHESLDGICVSSTDSNSLGWGKEVIRFWWPEPHFQGHTDTLKLKFLIEKSLCDTLISIRCIYIEKVRARGPIILELLPFVKIFLNAVKSLSAYYLFNQCLEFDQTSTDTGTLSGWGKTRLDFGDLDLIFKVTRLWILKKWALCALHHFFLHILISNIRNLNTFYINVHIH